MSIIDDNSARRRGGELRTRRALLDRPRRGHGIRRYVAERSDDAVPIRRGTLHMATKHMLASGFIAERSPSPRDGGEGARRRCHRITDSGRDAARDEAERIRLRLLIAVATTLLPGAESS